MTLSRNAFGMRHRYLLAGLVAVAAAASLLTCVSGEEGVDLEARCSLGGTAIDVRVQMKQDTDPRRMRSSAFEGLVYSREHPSTCRSSGRWDVEVTELHMGPDRQCGIRRSQARSGGGTEVDVYVQHDPFVQQVIDEQFLVQCLPGEEVAVVTPHQSRRRNGSGKRRNNGSNRGQVVRNVKVTSKFGSSKYGSSRTKKQRVLPEEEEEEHQIQSQEQQSEQQILLRSFVHEEDAIVSNLVDSNLDVIAEAPVWVEKNNGGGKVEKEEKVEDEEEEGDAAWMELEWPGSEDGGGGTDLEEGDEVSLVLRLRQAAGRDASVGTCFAFGGSTSDASDVIRLTDRSGCSVRRELLPDFSAAFNSRTGVKALRTSFPAFRPSSSSSSRGGGGRMSVRCQVLVCGGNCPVARCGGEQSGVLMADRGKVINAYWLQTHAEVSRGKGKSGRRRNSRNRNSSRPEGIVARAWTAAEEEQGREEEEEESLLGAEEKEEVREAFEEQELLRRTRIDILDETSLPEASSASLMCVSPPRLLVAFSVLLLVLLLALVCACALWARARGLFAGVAVGGASGGGSSTSGTPLLAVKRGSPPPPHGHIMAARGPPPPPPPPPPGPPPGTRRGPHVIMQRGMPPYIRVMH